MSVVEHVLDVMKTRFIPRATLDVDDVTDVTLVQDEGAFDTLMISRLFVFSVFARRQT